MSIRVRFMLLMILLGLMTSLSLAVISYQLTLDNAHKEARLRGKLVYDYMSSTRDFFRLKQLPRVYEAAGREIFIPEIMSSFAVIRGVFESFSKRTPDYILKQATKNPLVPSNKADAQELELIAYFNENRNLAQEEGKVVKNGLAYYYFAQPIRVGDETCLACHGDPADAPDEQLDIYGQTNGYFWEVDDTVSSLIIYVPVQKAIEQARKQAAILFAAGAACITVLMLIIFFFFNRYIFRPMAMLEQRATEISLGKNLQEGIVMESRDEIGSLGRAIDRLRISIDKMLTRYNK